MEVQAAVCAGIDVGKADVKVCVRRPGRRAGTRVGQVRTFGTTTRQLLALRDWLLAERVTRIAMESTGVYWKPVYYLLEDVAADGECWLVNAQHIKKVPGRKTDVSDAAWIAQVAEVGLIRPSFVPPQPIRELRDLTRYRTVVVRDRTREVQRLHAVLEDAGIKLDVFVSDILGVSGRHMIEALIAGERNPQVLAELALGRMRGKRAVLAEALVGRFTAHHAWLCRMILDRIDANDADLARLDAHIAAAMASFRDTITRLCTIPGVGQRIAEVIIAETGADMTRFATAGELSSWAGFCPGNNESAGKHFTGRTRKGDRWLAGALGEAASAAARTRGTHLAERHRRLAHRRGRKRALVATGRIILETAWTLLHDPDQTYRDLGAGWHQRRQPNPRRRATNLVHQLQVMGYDVTINQAVA